MGYDYDDDNLVPYEAGNEDESDVLDDDEEESYSHNEVSVKTSFLIFAVVAILMIGIFILNVFHVLPWWGTMISSGVVLIVIFILYVRSKSR